LREQVYWQYLNRIDFNSHWTMPGSLRRQLEGQPGAPKKYLGEHFDDGGDGIQFSESTRDFEFCLQLRLASH
jgi:hypothetical protein